MERAKAMVYGSFIGDSLALGVHYIYNVKAIEKRVGRTDDLIAPVVKRYHPNRGAGDFTHYGDQMLFLLEFCAQEFAGGGIAKGEEESRPSLFKGRAFLRRWVSYMESYDGYMDHASKDTLSNYRKLLEENREPEGNEAASQMDDLAGASRIAPLLYYFLCGPNELSKIGPAVESAKAQAAVTHNHPQVLETAAFFTELTIAALQGETPVKRSWELIDGSYADAEIATLVRRGLESSGKDSTQAIAEFGQACSVEHGLPSVMHLLVRYEEDLQEALIASVMAGGDSAARNHAVGMILGAYNGVDDLPEKWFKTLKAGNRIEELL